MAKSQCFVLMVDICKDSHTSQMIEYAVMAMKEVFQREYLNDLTVFLFAYDTNLSYYDFSGSEPTRIVVNL